MTILFNSRRRVEMKKLAFLIAIVALVGITFETGSFARMGMKWRGSGGWGMGSTYNSMYHWQHHLMITMSESCLARKDH